MALLLLLGVCFLWFVLAGIVRDRHARAKERRDERIVAAYQRQEAARMHAWNLAHIQQVREVAIQEMLRVADNANGHIVEGTAVEVMRRDR